MIMTTRMTTLTADDIDFQTMANETGGEVFSDKPEKRVLLAAEAWGLFQLDCPATRVASKVFSLRPRSGLRENSPALQRWVTGKVSWSP